MHQFNPIRCLHKASWLIALLFYFTSNAYSQSQLVKGKVSDNNNESLPGVSVKVKATNVGAVTDINGNFTINAPQGSTLVFTYIGFATKEVRVSGTDLVVKLSESHSQLNEVVVVGYGTQKKSNVIGSVAQINSDDLKQAPTMNVTNMLAGRLPGITALQQSGRPGADNSALRIRGTNSYAGGATPVVIMDGVTRTFDQFSQLDPNEIENISILKDAVASAVFGINAANGIILVTTKRGKNQKAVISYDAGVNVNSNTRFPKFLNGPDYMEWYTKAQVMDNEYFEKTGQGLRPMVYTQEEIDAVRNGTNTNPLLGNTDWVGELLDNTSTTQTHSVTVRGGTDKIRYFSNLNYLGQDGIVDRTGYKRYNARTNLDAEINPVLSVALDLNVRKQKTNAPGILPENTAFMNPFFQAVRALPNMPKTINGIPTAYNSGGGYVNPLASVTESGYQNSESDVFQGGLTFNINVPWVKGLKGKLLTTYDKTSTQNKSWTTPYQLMGKGRDQISGDFIPVTPPGLTVNTLRQSYNQNNRISFQPSLNYNRTFGHHTFEVLALYEWSEFKSNIFSTGARNFTITNLHEINLGSKDPLDVIAPTGSSGVDARHGYVGRVNYAYKNKYLVEVAARVDESLNFPEGQRTGFFPGAGLGWIVSEEAFFEKMKNTFSFFKVKASMGSLGKNDAAPFAYLSSFQRTTDPVVVIGGVPMNALYSTPPPNFAFTWEKHTMYNAGFETEIKGGKFGVDFDYFYRIAKDILDGVGGLYPFTVGHYVPSTVNNGVAVNQGIDLQLKHRNKLGDFRYSLTGNFNWARNKIIKRNENPNLPSWQRTVGRSVGEKMGFIVDGFYETWEEAANGSSPSAGTLAPGFFKYRDLNGDGRITRDADMTFVGKSNMPEIMFGLNIELGYKGFDFSALFQGAALSSVALGGLYEGSSGTSGIEDNSPFTRTFYSFGNSPYYLLEESWSPDNPNAKFARLTTNTASFSPHNANANSAHIINNDYLRLKAIQFGYTLPKSLFKSGIESMRLNVSGFNLFTWDKLKYLDPESPNVNNGFYPQQKMISAGLSVVF